MFSKEFVALYILLGTMTAGVSTMTAAIQSQSARAYDVSTIGDSTMEIVNTVHLGMEEQDQAMQDWIEGSPEEKGLANQRIKEWDDRIQSVINP